MLECYFKVLLSVISALSRRETGQPFSAASASLSKVAWSVVSASQREKLVKVGAKVVRGGSGRETCTGRSWLPRIPAE